MARQFRLFVIVRAGNPSAGYAEVGGSLGLTDYTVEL